MNVGDIYNNVMNHPALTNPSWYYGDVSSKKKIKVGKKKPAGKGKKPKRFGRKK